MTHGMDLEKDDALMIVDVQNDFCPGGALPIDEGDRVVPVINDWIREAATQNIPVFASRDWHPKNHNSFEEEGGKWPPHCLQDTPGALFHKDLKLPPSAVVVTKGVRFDQDQNSAFDQTGLEVYMKRRGIRRLFISGLALDVCVLATALDARKHGIEVVLVPDATRPVSQEGGAQAMKRMSDAGVTLFENHFKRSESLEDRPGENGSMDLNVCTKSPEWAEHQRFDDSDQPCDDGRSG